MRSNIVSLFSRGCLRNHVAAHKPHVPAAFSVASSSPLGGVTSSLLSSSSSSTSSSATSITAADQKEAAAKVWCSLHASSNALKSAETGSAGTTRITHNLNYSNAKWQASCVEVRPRIRDGETDESKINPVIAKRNKQFGQQMPWESKAGENKNKFPKSDKFPADDDVEIVFYFETHGDDGAGLKGYQHIAARVSNGDLPGECCNLTAVGGFATWTVPRSEFVALTESTPLLGDMLTDTPPLRKKRSGEKGYSANDPLRGASTPKGSGETHDPMGDDAPKFAMEDHKEGEGESQQQERGDVSDEQLRKVTIRMSTSTERERHDEIPVAQEVRINRKG